MHSARSRSRSRLVAVPAALGLAAAGLSLAAAGPATAGTPAPTGVLALFTDSVVGSTVAANGDTNPYGVVVIPAGTPATALTQPGDVLVTNFNNSSNVEGAGTSVVRIRGGVTSTLSTAVHGPVAAALNANASALWVSDFGANPANTAGTAGNGDVSVLSTANGQVVHNTTGGTGLLDDATTAGAPTTPASSGGTSFQGPWGQAFNHSVSAPAFFWTNVVDGSVYRVGPKLTPPAFNTDPITLVASGLPHVGAGAASDGGPQGMFFDSLSGTLYVADTADDSVVALPGAGTATAPVTPVTVLRGGSLHGPTGLVADPALGALLTVGTDNVLTAVTPGGVVLGTRDLLPGAATGSLFGVTTATAADGSTDIYYTDSATNSVHELQPNATVSRPSGFGAVTHVRSGRAVTLTVATRPAVAGARLVLSTTFCRNYHGRRLCGSPVLARAVTNADGSAVLRLHGYPAGTKKLLLTEQVGATKSAFVERLIIG